MNISTGPAVVLLSDPPAVRAEEYFVAADKRIEGNPRQTVWLEYQDLTTQFSAGMWSSEVGAWRIRYTEEEYCRILQGQSVITDEAGNSVTVGAGDEFTIPAGFVGTWRVVEPTLKRFVIYERASVQAN